MSNLILNFFNWHVAREMLPFMLVGLGVMIYVSAVSIALTVAFGVLFALLRHVSRGPMAWALVAYVDVMRAMPPVMLMVLVYFALPFIGVNLPVTAAVIASLTLQGSAYASEIFRGALKGVPRGQSDAALALGFTVLQEMWHVVLPQAFRIALPPLTSEAVTLVKLTSVGFVIGLPEVLNQARLAQDLVHNSTPLTAAAVIYLALLLPLSRASGWLEGRLRRGVLSAR
jgi:polar amino acid transport system permease protein